MSNKANRFRGNKFNAKKAVCRNEHTHDSKKEATRCDELHTLLAHGLIADLTIQPQYWFVINGKQVKHANGRRVGYRPDFNYVMKGIECVEDCKGFITADYTLRKAIFKALFPHIEFIES